MEFFKRFTLGILVVSVVVLAIVVSALRLAIENIDYFKPEIEYLLERDLASGLVFTGLSGDIKGFNPVVGIDNVSITLPDKTQPLFIDRLEMELDFWASWRERTLVVREVSGKLEKLELVKNEDGVWLVNDVPINIGPRQGPTPEFRQVLAQVPRYLNLSLNRLIVRDLKEGDTHQLDRIEARINHEQDQFFVRLSTALPEQLGQGLVMKSIVGPRTSLIYLNATNLQLSPVARLFDLDTWGLQQGALDGELWINMAAYDVLGVNGDFLLKNGMVRVAPENPLLGVSFKSRFSALRIDSRWRVANEMQRLNINNRNVAAFRSQLEFVSGAKNRLLSAWVDHLQVQSLPVVAGQWLPARVSEQVVQGEFDGQLRDIWFQIDLERPQDFYFGARADAVSNRAFGAYPGATNLNADIVAGNRRLGARIFGEGVSLDFGNHFNAPIEIDQLDLQASGQRFEDRMVFAVDDLAIKNPDVSAVGRMWLEIDQHHQPFTFIRASFSDVDGRSTSKYLPRNHMPLPTQAWLDRGIKDGFVPAGEMQFHGRLRDIRELTREQAGEFFVDFTIERGDVYFSPGWLQAKNGQGRILFHNVSMDILLDRVSYDQLDNARARASISNFNEPVLELRIETETSTELAVSTWLDTPVGKQYRRVMSNLHDLDGEVGATVKVNLPLKDDEPEADVEVQIQFDNAGARADAWGLDLSRVNGEMKVTPKQFYARQIEARFFDDPVKIDIDTLEPSGNAMVKVNGAIESRNLFNKLPGYISQHLHGKSNWNLRLNIAGISTPPEEPFLRLNVSSNLENTRFALPPPFAKEPDTVRKISADIDFFPEQIWFRTLLGDDISGRGQLLPVAGGDFELNLLDIAFASDLRVKPQKGVHLYGSIEDVSIDDWARYFKDSGESKPELLASVALSFDRAQLLGRELGFTRIEFTRGDRSFVGSIDSTTVSGDFTVPWHPAEKTPLVLELDFLRVDRVEEKTGESELLPSDLVDFRLDTRTLLFHDMLFNDLHVEARRVADKLVIDKLSLKKEQLVLEGKAEWEYDLASKSHLSSVSMSVRGENMGAALAGMGFGDSMTRGRLNFTGGFTWPAPLVAFNSENLVGDARFRVEDGILNNVEPGGSGRFVGLFSLGALPRRLSLDFSDVLIKGMEFDEIVGTYSIERGILKTEDTRMEGTAAVIKITGETDIPDQTYDQSIVVTPKISQTLPVLGAVSVSTTVGWGLLLLQSLFKKNIDGAAEVEYRVTGTWDDPKIDLVKAIDENKQELPKIER